MKTIKSTINCYRNEKPQQMLNARHLTSTEEYIQNFSLGQDSIDDVLAQLSKNTQNTGHTIHPSGFNLTVGVLKENNSSQWSSYYDEIRHRKIESNEIEIQKSSKNQSNGFLKSDNASFLKYPNSLESVAYQNSVPSKKSGKIKVCSLVQKQNDFPFQNFKEEKSSLYKQSKLVSDEVLMRKVIKTCSKNKTKPITINKSSAQKHQVNCCDYIFNRKQDSESKFINDYLNRTHIPKISKI